MYLSRTARSASPSASDVKFGPLRRHCMGFASRREIADAASRQKLWARCVELTGADYPAPTRGVAGVRRA